MSTTYDDLIDGGTGGTRQFDTSSVHDFGNIWLRVSNYGFFGSGETEPKWPSLEYPGGSAIDYLYLGGLWFGAKKIRRDELGRKLYWLDFPDDAIPESGQPKQRKTKPKAAIKPAAKAPKKTPAAPGKKTATKKTVVPVVENQTKDTSDQKDNGANCIIE